MRRILIAVALVVAALAVAGCSSDGSMVDSNGRTVVTAPATRARGVVAQQNQQLQQIQQQTAQADPTSP
jgi:uncharacterized protein YcfL